MRGGSFGLPVRELVPWGLPRPWRIDAGSPSIHSDSGWTPHGQIGGLKSSTSRISHSRRRSWWAASRTTSAASGRRGGARSGVVRRGVCRIGFRLIRPSRAREPAGRPPRLPRREALGSPSAGNDSGGDREGARGDERAQKRAHCRFDAFRRLGKTSRNKLKSGGLNGRGERI